MIGRKVIAIYNRTDSDLILNPMKHNIDKLLEPGTSEVVTLCCDQDVSVHSKYGSYILSLVSDLGGLTYYKFGDLRMIDDSAKNGTISFFY